MGNATSKSSNLLKTIVITGSLAGTLDILAAMISYYLRAKSPDALLVFKFIASGIFGKEAFGEGMLMPILGLLLHYLIAFSFTIFFFVSFKIFYVISKNKYLIGIIYGFLVWIVMNLIVLPISNTPKSPFVLSQVVIGITILMLCIGLPISLSAYRFYLKDRN